MTSEQALADVKGYAAAGRIVVSTHAAFRMAQRNVRAGDLRSALVNAKTCRAGKDGCWLVDGPDLDGDDLRVCCALEGGVVVITVY